MDSFCKLIWSALVGLFRSRASLQAENLVLRHQLNVLRRKFPQRITSSTIDRLLFAGLYALVPSVLDALQIVKPDTVIRWHRDGFRAYWRWKSGSRGGRPGTPTEIRQLIRQIAPQTLSGVRPVSMVNCSSSGSMSARPRWQSTWRKRDGRPAKAGEHFSTIMLMASPQWIYLWCRQFRSGCCMEF